MPWSHFLSAIFFALCTPEYCRLVRLMVSHAFPSLPLVQQQVVFKCFLILSPLILPSRKQGVRHPDAVNAPHTIMAVSPYSMVLNVHNSNHSSGVLLRRNTLLSFSTQVGWHMSANMTLLQSWSIIPMCSPLPIELSSSCSARKWLAFPKLHDHDIPYLSVVSSLFFHSKFSDMPYSTQTQLTRLFLQS